MPSASRPLQRGEAVRVRGERWRVIHLTPHDGCAVVELAGAERSNAGSRARFVVPFETLDRVPAAVDAPRVVSRTAWRSVARPSLADAAPTWPSLRAAARADIALWAFQLEPALAMTRGLACRFLLADEVGLGKTIQAGLLVAELLAREHDARVLIVTPAGLRDQWRDELRDRFGIEAQAIDASALVRATTHLPEGVNPWAIPQVAITSIDFLKRADVIRSLEPLVWDLVAFDEAHALCGRSDRAMAADLVAARARRVVIITATPHGGDAAAFERLQAIGRVGADDPLLTFRRSRLEAGIPRARVTRRLHVTPTPAEARMHRALGAYAARVARDAPAETAGAARLAMIVLGRRAASSAASLARSIERRLGLLDIARINTHPQLRLPLRETEADDDEPIDELAARGLPDVATEERLLRDLLALARAVAVESKIAALRRLLARTREPVLVFTEYRDTLRHVASAVGGDCPMMHGGLTTAERAREARRFTHGHARLLLATDAASEGLNLHRRCRVVINLDVPWTPLRLEQRVGRVDRLGQRRRVHAVTFVARGTPEAIVAATLASRSRRAEREAPFADAAGGTLREAARLEASRLDLARRLAGATTHIDDSHRPVLVSLPRRSRDALLLAVRFFFVDSSGAPVWDTIKGFIWTTTTAGCNGRRSGDVRRWFENEVRGAALSLAGASAFAHEGALASLRRDLDAAILPLVSRERAILDRLNAGGARLAAPLLQPGLFDRRAVREADAQRRVAAEAANRVEERIRALERKRHVRLGERRLVVALASSR